MKFRIIRDNHRGYEAQYWEERRLFYWFKTGQWREIDGDGDGTFGTNTRASVKDAEELIREWAKYRKKIESKGVVVKVLEHEVSSNDL
jgi:hypothetical protein